MAVSRPHITCIGGVPRAAPTKASDRVCARAVTSSPAPSSPGDMAARPGAMVKMVKESALLFYRRKIGARPIDARSYMDSTTDERGGLSAQCETAKSPANVAAAPHRSAAQSPGEVLPLDPPIQSPARLLPHLVQDAKPTLNILRFRNLYTRISRDFCSRRLMTDTSVILVRSRRHHRRVDPIT